MAGIPDEWAAFQFDAAALALGKAVDNALQENVLKKKGRLSPTQIVNRLLGERPAETFTQPAPIPARSLRPDDPDWAEWATVLGLNPQE
jgi:hypothetical protein